jgi:hypothetical protein
LAELFPELGGKATAERNSEKESLGRLFVRELVSATSWGIVFLLVVAIFAIGAKQNIKWTLDFSFKRAAG